MLTVQRVYELIDALVTADQAEKLQSSGES